MSEEIDISVWDALSDTEQEAANLKARSALLFEIRNAVFGWGLSQDEAARRLGLTRPRTNDLLRGKLSKFSLDALFNIASAARDRDPCEGRSLARSSRLAEFLTASGRN